MKTYAIIVVLMAAAAAGVFMLVPLGESNAGGYMYPSYQPQMNYGYGSGYQTGYGYQTAMPTYNVPQGWSVSCPTGYTWTGSVCYWQGMNYGYGYNYGYHPFAGPYNMYGYGGGYDDNYYGYSFYNARFFDAEFDDDFDFDDDDDDEDDDDEITVNLRADDTSIDEGDSTTLRWDVDGNADSCSASNSEDDNDFEGSVDEDGGSERVSPDEDTTYRITCRNDDDTDTDSVTIRVDED